jgi:hypothetical protein
MITTTIREAYPEDFPEVLPLLHQFRSSNLLKDEDWQRLFNPRWLGNRGTCGLILLANNRPVGFIHSLFSQRIINGKPRAFCNLGSWIVEPDYRSKSMSLFFPLMKMTDITFTSISANPRFSPILEGFGFKSLEDTLHFLPPLPSLSRRAKVSWSFSDIEKTLVGEPKRIFTDHEFLSCEHILLNTPKGPCYLIFNRTRKKRLPMAYLNYISDLDPFLKYIVPASAKICAALRVAALIIGSHSLKDHRLPGSIKTPRLFKLWYRSKDLSPFDVDTLYSEYQVLGLKPS